MNKHLLLLAIFLFFSSLVFAIPPADVNVLIGKTIDANTYIQSGTTFFIDFNVIDRDTNIVSLLFDINYNSVDSNSSTGTVIVDDANVAKTANFWCDSNVIQPTPDGNAVTCHYKWTIPSLDGNRFIIVEALEATVTEQDWNTSKYPFWFDNTVPVTSYSIAGDIVSLSVSEASGNYSTQYRKNSGDWTAYSSSFSCPSGTILDYNSLDKSNRYETTQTVTCILNNPSGGGGGGGGGGGTAPPTGTIIPCYIDYDCGSAGLCVNNQCYYPQAQPPLPPITVPSANFLGLPLWAWAITIIGIVVASIVLYFKK